MDWIMVGLLICVVIRGGEFGSFKSTAGIAWVLWCFSLEVMGEVRGKSNEFLNDGAKIGGGAIIGLVKDSGKTMEGSDTTGFVLGFPNVERSFPLDIEDGDNDDDGGGIKGTVTDDLFISVVPRVTATGLFISMGTGGGAIGRRSFWGGGGGGGAMRTLSLGSPEWGATAIMGRLDSGPNTVVRCVRLRERLEPMATPAGEFGVVTTLNPLDVAVRT